MTLHTYIPQPMSLPYINIFHPRVSEIYPEQALSHHMTANLDTMGETNTHRALKVLGAKIHTLKDYYKSE